MDSGVNDILHLMHQSETKEKGTLGEDAVFEVLKDLRKELGGYLFHSYTYRTIPGLPGNIKFDGRLYLENLGAYTEIDVIYGTENRVFMIEVKSYKGSTIRLTDDRIYGCANTSKSPIHQNEMHGRHLYSQIFKALPKGSSKYIVPLTVFVDKTIVKDERSDEQKKRYYVCVLNNLKNVIRQLNRPLPYRMNIEDVFTCLKQAALSFNEMMPIYKESE